ncbi:MAG TPA: hydroxyacid dehydrogenase [Tepidisphaeraceae bacterium]|jgi:phosphoglycerate dehydrogenase-like enzyme
MASKFVVALALSPEMAKKMFRIEDLDRLHSVVTVRGPLPSNPQFDDYRKIVADANILITGWGTMRINQPLLAAAPKLKLIAHSAGSVKGIVDETVYDRGIRVTTAASANAISVAQYTVAMITAMLKQVPWIGTAYARGEVEEVRRRRSVIRELMDLNIGIIAASRVGREVIAMLKAYPRLTIKCYDPYLTPEQAQELGVELVSLNDACRCDVVSIHAPNIPETNRMFNARTLALLPDHCVLINTARGALIDEEALVAELKRRPLYACLDVTDPEPPKPDSPLRTAPNLILTPHIAGALQQACRDMGQLAIDEALRFAAGQKLHHEVTRAMLPTQA